MPGQGADAECGSDSALDAGQRRTDRSAAHRPPLFASSTSSSASLSTTLPASTVPIRSLSRQTLLNHLHSFGSSSTIEFEASPALAETAAAARNPRAACQGSDGVIRQTTPLPRRVMFVLSVITLGEPMSMTILFPFVYFMVRDFGIADEKNIGFYVGFIASSFSLAQFLTSLFWGWVSDRVGRRPVLLLGLIGNTISLLMFGQSHSLWWAIMSRSLCGFLNGNVGVAKSLLGEITDATNQTKAFSLFGLMWSIGMICGPILGGFLANPATTYPGLFGGCPFLRANPYFLPCLLSASISVIGFTVGFFYLEETLPRLRGYTAVRTDDEIAGREEAASPGVSDSDTLSTSPNHTERGCSSGAMDRDSVATVTEYEQEFSIEDARSAVEAHNTDAVCCRTSDVCQTEEKRLLSKASVRVITGYSLLSFLSIIFDETLSLWSVTSPSHGGLGFTSSDIGFCLSLMGCTTLVMQLVVYPNLGRFFSPLHLYQIGVSFYGIVYLGFPFISTYIVASPSSYIRRLTWPLLLLNLAMRHVCNVLAFTSVMIMVNNSATRGNLGLVNGVSQTSAAFVRCIGPALGGIMWAWSLTNELPFPFNYWFVFLCLSILGLVTSVQSRYIPESVGRRRDKVQTLSPSEH